MKPHGHHSVVHYCSHNIWPLCHSFLFDGLFNQFGICQSFIQRAREHRVNAVEGVIGTRALIESEGELVDIPLQMLGRDMVVDAIDTTLQNGPHALNPVGVDIAINEFFRAVFHGVVSVEQAIKTKVAAVIVSVKDGSGLARSRRWPCVWLADLWSQAATQ